MKWLYATLAALLLLCVSQVTEAGPFGVGYGYGASGGCCGGSWSGGNYDHLWAGYGGGYGWRAGLWSGYCGQSQCCTSGSRGQGHCSWLGGLRLRRAWGVGYGCGCGATTASCGCGTAVYGTTSYGGCCGGTSGETVTTYDEGSETAPPSPPAEEAAPPLPPSDETAPPTPPTDDAAPALDAPPALDDAPAPSEPSEPSASLRRYHWSALQVPALYR